MAGILSRIADIMSANINDMLDKCEDPSKMIDEELRKAMENLGKVKDETADVMAAEQQAKRAWEQADAKVKDMHGLALKAVKAGNDADAEKFLQEERKLNSIANQALGNYEQAQANSQKMKDAYNKLASDIELLKSRRDGIKSTVAIAKATETVNNFKQPGRDVSGALDKYEAKANRMLDKAQAKANLDSEPTSEMDELKDKYNGTPDVSDDLAALKREAGIV